MKCFCHLTVKLRLLFLYFQYIIQKQKINKKAITNQLKVALRKEMGSGIHISALKSERKIELNLPF